jgi:hypothetical protein
MIIVKNMAAQGDVLLRRVAAIPQSASERRQPRASPTVVAQSETGHHHVIESGDVKLFESPNPLVSYLKLEGPFADVVHRRPYDTHETLRLLSEEHRPSYFEVRRQREYAPGGWRGVRD